MEQEAEITKVKLDEQEAANLREYIRQENDLTIKAQVANYAKTKYFESLVNKYQLPSDKRVELNDNDELQIGDS